MKPLTKTQLEYIELLKKFGYILVSEGVTFATFHIGNKQMGTTSFNALQEHNIIECVSSYTQKGHRISKSVWKINESALK